MKSRALRIKHIGFLSTSLEAERQEAYRRMRLEDAALGTTIAAKVDIHDYWRHITGDVGVVESSLNGLSVGKSSAGPDFLSSSVLRTGLIDH